MKCPFCNRPNVRVIDSRDYSSGEAIRRRRHCTGCQCRFSTLEMVEELRVGRPRTYRKATPKEKPEKIAVPDQTSVRDRRLALRKLFLTTKANVIEEALQE